MSRYPLNRTAPRRSLLVRALLLGALAAMLAAARALQNSGDWEGVTVGLTGNPVLRTEELRSVSQGIEISLIVSAIAVAILRHRRRRRRRRGRYRKHFVSLLCRLLVATQRLLQLRRPSTLAHHGHEQPS